VRNPNPARVTYRRATSADLEVLTEHRHRMWTAIGRHTEAEITEHDLRYRRWAKPRLRSGELLGFVAEARGGLAVGSGLVWLRPDQPRPQIPGLVSPYILSMYTCPDWRGQGIASALVRRLVTVCRASGYPNVELHASVQGRHVYRRLGFERTWEMRFWIDPRIRRRRAAAATKVRPKRKNGLDRAR